MAHHLAARLCPGVKWLGAAGAKGAFLATSSTTRPSNCCAISARGRCSGTTPPSSRGLRGDRGGGAPKDGPAGAATGGVPATVVGTVAGVDDREGRRGR